MDLDFVEEQWQFEFVYNQQIRKLVTKTDQKNPRNVFQKCCKNDTIYIQQGHESVGVVHLELDLF